MTVSSAHDQREPGPLTGMRVLELGHFVAAPFAARLLGDLGAEVIKIEPPGGDPVRQWGATHNGHSPWWSVHARNKRSVVLDLKKPQARSVVLDLLTHCDALVENLRPGGLDKLGLTREVVMAARPDLVVARISGYGQQGPGYDKPAFGVIAEAIGGLRHLTDHPPGTSDLPPVRVGVSLGDSIAGIYAALGVVAALWRRDRQGRAPDAGARGAEVDVALTDSVLSLLEGALPEYGALGTVRQPTGAAISTAAPTNAYRSRDGIWILVAANSDPLFERLARLMEQPGLLADERFADNRARVRHAADLDALIASWAATHDAQELTTRLDAAGVPNTRVFTVADIADDPQYRARAMVQTVDDPLQGPMLHPGIVPRFVGGPLGPRSTGPALGADTESLLTGLLGYDADKLANLRGAGVI